MATLNEVLGPNWQQQAAAYTYHGRNNQLDIGGAVPFTLGDGKTYYLMKQTGTGEKTGDYVLFTDNGSINLQYDANGNFKRSYAGNEPGITGGDILRGIGTIGAGMGLGALATAGGAAGAAGAASAASGEGAALGGVTGTGAAGSVGASGGLAGATAGGLESGTLANGVTVGGPMSVGGATGTALPSMGSMAGVGGAAGAASAVGGAGGLSSLLPAGVTLGDLAKVGGGLAGIAGSIQGGNAQQQASNDMLGYLRSQQAKIDSLYAPGSPEYNLLMQQMQAKDAAAGRNSQYGIRAVDLAGKIAQTKAQYTAGLTGSTAGNMQTAFNQGAASNAGLNATIGNLSNNSGFVDSLSKFF